MIQDAIEGHLKQNTDCYLDMGSLICMPRAAFDWPQWFLVSYNDDFFPLLLSLYKLVLNELLFWKWERQEE